MDTLHEQLIWHLSHHPDWHHKGALTDDRKWKHYEKGVPKVYTSETVGRALRRLEEENHIAVRYENGNALYKFLPKEYRSRYIPLSLRSDKAKLFR